MQNKLSCPRMPKTFRFTIFSLLHFLIHSTIHAQDGNAGLTQANTMIRGYYDNAVQLLYAISALLAIIGAINVYSKWGHDGREAQKAAVLWFGGSIFIATVSTVIKSFYGI